MSKIALSPDPNGAGIFTIASPNSGTNRTLTLPDNTGTVVSTASTPTFTGAVTAPAFTPNSSTVPTDGMFLPTTSTVAFATGTTERARIDSSGNLLIGKITGALSTAGGYIQANGEFGTTVSGGVCIYVNRLASDGTLMEFRQGNTAQGSISVSGTTVSYNAFSGSHWSQLQDGSKPEILRGTVMESIDELCEWPDEPTSERLCRVKISDTAGSKKVYGVFMCWDEDWTATNDMMVTAVGAFICRVNKDVVVQEGDLLESNGDGTARVQADDIMRSSTIGKVTCTVKTYEYEDGSYCVPTVLYCG